MVDDPHIQRELAKLDAVPATKLDSVAAEWQALDEYVARKAYVAARVRGGAEVPLGPGRLPVRDLPPAVLQRLDHLAADVVGDGRRALHRIARAADRTRRPTSLALGGLDLGLLTLSGDSLLVPALIIGFVYVPYVAKPIRAQVLGPRERDFVEAARSLGAGDARIVASEILPNVTSTIIVFAPLILANAILLEAGLSYLGAGIQPPNPSWGTMIGDGIELLPSSIHMTLVPGAMLVLAVLGINVLGDGVREALDPHGSVRVPH